MVNPTFSNTPSTDEENNPTKYVIFDSLQLTLDRTVTFPDLNVKVVGEHRLKQKLQRFIRVQYSRILILNWVMEERFSLIYPTLRIIKHTTLTFPNNAVAAPLNNPQGEPNILVYERKTQTLYNKTVNFSLNNPNEVNGIITIDTSNITEGVTIQFPNADATLLSTNNISNLCN